MADYLHPERYPKWYKGILDAIRETLKTKLADYPNFVGIDFNDVSAGGIQISGRHKESPGYYYVTTTLAYNCENCGEAVASFITGWKASDNKRSVDSFRGFIADGEKYGWD